MIYFLTIAAITATVLAVVAVMATKDMPLVSGATLLIIGLFGASLGLGAITYPVFHSISKESAVGGYHQYLNGSLVSADMEHFACTKDGPCFHEYDCDHYVTYTTEYTYDSKGNISGSYEQAHDNWHDCPYTTEEFSYTVTDSFGNTYSLGDHNFAAQPVAWKKSKLVPRDVYRGVPPRWQHAHDSLVRGDSDPVTITGEYKNYILSSEDTILRAASSDIDQLKRAKLLPDHTRNYKNPIYSDFLADKISFVGLQPSNAAAWQDSLMRFNAGLGMTRRGDMHIVVVKASAIPRNISSEDYLLALKAYWLNNLGKYALAKNGIALVLAVDDSGSTIQWAKATTGMPIGNGVMLQRLSSQLSGLPFTPAAVLGTTTARVDATTHKVSYTPGSGRASQIIMQEFPFVRACMECKDKDEKGQHSFVDLSDQIPLSTGGRVWGTIVLLLVLVIGGFWIYDFLGVDLWYDKRIKALENEKSSDWSDNDRYSSTRSSKYYGAGTPVTVRPRRKAKQGRKARYEL